MKYFLVYGQINPLTSLLLVQIQIQQNCVNCALVNKIDSAPFSCEIAKQWFLAGKTVIT